MGINNEYLTLYQDQMCQYIGSLGFSVLEAYCKAFSIRPEQVDDKVRAKAQALVKRKAIKEQIESYNKNVRERALDQARDALAYEKQDAMKDLMLLMEKCRKSLETPNFDESILSLIENFLCEHFEKEDRNGRTYIDKSDQALINEIMFTLRKPVMNHKVGELLNKTVRSASELYGLVDITHRLSVDDDAKKLIVLLQSQNLSDLKQIAYGEEPHIYVSQPQIATGTADTKKSRRK